MERDYHALQQLRLDSTLSDLEQALDDLERAGRARDERKKRRAETELKKAAGKAVHLQPHLAYLWFWALREQAKRAGNKPLSRRASDAANRIRDFWCRRLPDSIGRIPDAFGFVPHVKDQAFTYMPPLAFALKIPFRLEKPYISKDDCDFYLLDNPLRKEKIFNVPMVAASGWKGALRAAFWQLGYKEDHPVIIRLLGNPRESEEGRAGRLHFYPTFFDRIGIEVINPHSRESGVGERGPILMECVPQNTTGTLILLYVPFGSAGQGEQEQRLEVAQDLEVLAEGVRAMLTTYGFGAKTSSGFGTADDQLDGQGVLVLRAELHEDKGKTVAVSEPPQRANDLPRYLETPDRLRADLRRPDGSLKSETEYRALVEARKQRYSKKYRQLYEKAQRWWEREGRQLWEAGPKESGTTPSPIETPPISELKFTTLSEMRELAQRVADQLRNGGEA